jgi:hypothetical protein
VRRAIFSVCETNVLYGLFVPAPFLSDVHNGARLAPLAKSEAPPVAVNGRRQALALQTPLERRGDSHKQ